MTPYGDTSEDASVRVKGGSDDGSQAWPTWTSSRRPGRRQCRQLLQGLAGKPGDDVVKGDEGRDIVTTVAAVELTRVVRVAGRDFFVSGNDGDGRDLLDCSPGVDNFIADGDRVLADCEINGV
jgi:hypothetical protein